MEIAVAAPQGGTVVEILCAQGSAGRSGAEFIPVSASGIDEMKLDIVSLLDGYRAGTLRPVDVVRETYTGAFANAGERARLDSPDSRGGSQHRAREALGPFRRTCRSTDSRSRSKTTSILPAFRRRPDVRSIAYTAGEVREPWWSA